MNRRLASREFEFRRQVVHVSPSTVSSLKTETCREAHITIKSVTIYLTINEIIDAFSSATLQEMAATRR